MQMSVIANLKYSIVGAAMLVAMAAAHADAGYGRGPESDPIAMPILSAATQNVAVLQGQLTALQGRTSLWNQAATDASSATGAVAMLQSTVWGTPSLTPTPNGLENTVAIQAKNVAGGNLPGYRIIHVWVSQTDMGAASTNNIGSLVLSTGTAIATVSANADYWYCTASNGSAIATVTATAAGTNYIMCADGAAVSSIPIIFTE